MSLFNGISNSILAGQGQSLLGGINPVSGAINSALGTLSGGIQDAFGGGPFGAALGSIGANQASTALSGLINNTIGSQGLGAIGEGVNILDDIANGRLDSAGLRLLDSGLLNSLIPGIGGIVSQARYWGTATPLFGGISPREAKQIIDQMQGINFAKKNLFLIEVSSQLFGDVSGRFNIFCTEASYSPQAITGTKRQIGAAHVDNVSSADPAEMRLTTMDDKSGFMKSWFKAHCAATAHQDGTVGVPADYAIKIKIVHAFISQDSNFNGYEDIGRFRTGSVETNLSRREDGLEDITMSFVQLDTFMSV